MQLRSEIVPTPSEMSTVLREKTIGEMIRAYTTLQREKAIQHPHLIDRVGNLQEIYNQQLDKILRKMMTEIIELEFEAMEDDPENHLSNTHGCVLYKMLYARKEKLTNNYVQYWFITINFKDEFVIEQIRQQKLVPFIKTKMKKKYIRDWLFTVEQRSYMDQEWYGYHTHILIGTNRYKKKSEILREFFRSFTNELIGKEKVDVRLATHTLKERCDYIHGIKKGKDKNLRIKNDICFRNHYGIKSYYTNDEVKFGPKESVKFEEFDEQKTD